MYVVELDFAMSNPPAVATLRVGKIESTDSALQLMAGLYEDIIAEADRTPLIHLTSDEHIALRSLKDAGPSINAIRKRLAQDPRLKQIKAGAQTTSNVGEVRKHQARLANNAEARAILNDIKLRMTDPQKPAHLVWHAGVTDMTYQANIFGPEEPAEGAKFHLLEIPLRPSIRVDDHDTAKERHSTRGSIANTLAEASTGQ